jgi:hypothetical protein
MSTKPTTFRELVGQAVWEPGNYHVKEFDESTSEVEGPPGGNTTRINVSTRELNASIEYAKNLCIAPRSPFVSFSLNPARTWITLKTAEGTPRATDGWTTYIKS